jgi:hypothetical protein
VNQSPYNSKCIRHKLFSKIDPPYPRVGLGIHRNSSKHRQTASQTEIKSRVKVKYIPVMCVTHCLVCLQITRVQIWWICAGLSLVLFLHTFHFHLVVYFRIFCLDLWFISGTSSKSIDSTHAHKHFHINTTFSFETRSLICLFFFYFFCRTLSSENITSNVIRWKTRKYNSINYYSRWVFLWVT